MKSFEKIALMLIFLMFIHFVYAQSCNDPDGGLNFSEKSCVTSDYGEYCDLCIDSELLIEAYCTEDKLNLTAYDCPDSCSDSKCVSSVATTTTIPETTTTTSTTTTTTTMMTTSTTIPSSEEPCSEEGDYCYYEEEISGYCVSKGYYNTHPGWFKYLTGNYSCGTNYCCIACAKNDCCWGLRGYCYSFETDTFTGCYGNFSIGGYSYKCGEKGGEQCVLNSEGYYLIDPQVEPPYGKIKCVASTEISTTSTTFQTTTISGSTTTSLPNILSIKTLQTNEKCDSCLDGCTIECNHIVRRENSSYDDKDFFKFTLDRRMKVRIRLNSTNIPNPKTPGVYPLGDYDLYAKWNGSCPDVGSYYCLDACSECTKKDCCNLRIGNYDCGPCSENIDEYKNMNEFCPENDERILEPGTYYFLVYNFAGNVPYDVNLICRDVFQTATTTISANTASGGGKTTTPIHGFTTTTFTSDKVTIYTEYTTTTEVVDGGKKLIMGLSTKNYILIIATILSLILLLFGVYKIISKKTEEPKPEYTKENIEQPLY
jgi:hypothetical protein